MGCSGRTAHRRLRLWEELGIWDRLDADLLRLLRQNEQLDPDLVIIDGVIVRAFSGGELTGPSPVDRAKPGSKHTLMVDRHGVPLAIHTAGANASDHGEIIPLVLDFPHVGSKVGWPKQLPDELYAAAGYDSEATRWLLAWLGIEPKINKRKTEHGSGLGKVRWVPEVDLALARMSPSFTSAFTTRSRAVSRAASLKPVPSDTNKDTYVDIKEAFKFVDNLKTYMNLRTSGLSRDDPRLHDNASGSLARRLTLKGLI